MKGFDVLKKRLIQFPGQFECHITVDINIDQTEVFRSDCHALGGTPIVIELEQEAHGRQPMIAKFIDGKDSDAYQQIADLYNSLGKRYEVTRLKVEAGIDNEGVPQSDELAKRLPETCYFEHHVRMNLPQGADILLLKALLQGFNAHLSNNAFAKSENGQQRFATQRFRELGKENAVIELEKLLAFISHRKIFVDKVTREFNIYDSNKDMDAGWEHGS